MRRPFYIVDVFAQDKYAGNQLAVVRHAAGLSDEEMLAITREMNYSETTFIDSDRPREGGYDVRIFTPGGEVPFAGHPTLGTAYVILNDVLRRPVDGVVLNLAVGQIPVRVEHCSDSVDTLWMTQNPPTFGPVHDARQIAGMLGLGERDVLPEPGPQVVSTGLPFIVAPLASLDAVRRCRPRPQALLDYVRSTEAKAILVYARETYHPQNHLNVRVFTEAYGIPEDPATGSANGCLAAYLSRYRVLGNAYVDVRVEQGYDIGRPSLLLLRAGPAGDGIVVHVGGGVIPVAAGELL